MGISSVLIKHDTWHHVLSLCGIADSVLEQCYTYLVITGSHSLQASNVGSELSRLLEGAIVLEEFCKELAAIIFVKHHASTAATNS